MIPALPCIFSGGPEEDTGHMGILCERDEGIARLLCTKVEEFTAHLPVVDTALDFMSWRERGRDGPESLLAGVVPSYLRRLFAMVRAASFRGPAKAKVLLEDMILRGEDGYARRNHLLLEIMQLPLGDQKRATYSFLRGDTPFWPPASRVRLLPPWSPLDGLPADLQAAFEGTAACVAGVKVVHYMH